MKRLRSNRAAATALAIVIAAMGVGGIWQPHDPAGIDLSMRHAACSLAHPLGTDQLGRDMLSRLMAGGWRTLSMLGVVVAIGFVGGTFLGTAAAFATRVTETVMLRLAELPIVLPTLVVAMTASAIFGLTPIVAGIALGLASLGPYALLAHALARQNLAQPYMHAAQALGASRRRQLVYHLLPNTLPNLFSQLGSTSGKSIVAYAALAFLGLGADTSAPDWGAMLFEYRPFIFDHPALIVWPGLAIAVPATSISLLADR